MCIFKATTVAATPSPPKLGIFLPHRPTFAGMKSTIYCLIAFFFINSAAALAQAPSATPQRKDNVILVQTADSAVAALKKLGQTFVAQGYTIDKLDKEFLTLTISPKSVSGKANIMLSARANATQGANSTLHVTGDFTGSVAGRPTGGSAYYLPSAFQVESAAFHELQKVIIAYPSGQLSYTKQ